MKALVTKSMGLWYELFADKKKYAARLRGKFKQEDKKLTNPIAVGDWVEIQSNKQNESDWVITDIYERKNYVVRASPRKKGHHHLIVSNIDMGALIVTLKSPRTSTGFIDRFLITLESFQIPSIILFNKKDIYSKKEYDVYESLKEMYNKLDYGVHLCEFQKGITSDLLSLFENKTTFFCGHSGAGKSTLINQLIPNASQEVKEISKFADKGVHTTTFAELFFINDKTVVIDTPGIKELGISEIEKGELSFLFPEIKKLASNCKYHNCLHENEPNCMVKEAIGKEITALRYKNYLSILRNEDNRK